MIKRHQLANGMTLVVEKIPSVRSVALGIWVKTGSRHELPDNNGISHFIEHLLFKGTTTRSAQDIAEAFDGIGGNVNAFTSKEYTCYYAKVLDEHLISALDVLSDMFFNSVFDPEDVNKERNVVIEEIGMYEDTPDDLVHLPITVMIKRPCIMSFATMSNCLPLSATYPPNRVAVEIAPGIKRADLMISVGVIPFCRN